MIIALFQYVDWTRRHKKISVFNERLNDKIHTMFKELFSNTNKDSVCKTLPTISKYNNEIARFVEDINVKNGILLNNTQLQVSEIHHWVETFQISTNPSNQPIPQQSQSPPVQATEPHSEPPHHPLPLLEEQQAEIDRLTCGKQWSTEELCRVSEGLAHYNNAGRGRSTCHYGTPNMSPVSHCYHHQKQYDRQGQHRYNQYDQRSQYHRGQELDQRRYSHTLQNTDNSSTLLDLNAVEYF